METVNPTTGQTITSYNETSSSDIEQILNQMQRSYISWRRLSFKERGVKMKAAAAVLRRNKDQYARLMADEMGKPLVQGQGEIEKCAVCCEFYAEHAESFLSPEAVKTTASKSFVAFEPLGIVLAVMPWNFPFWQVFRCAAPTLMAGNAMILKHASNVCGCALAIEDVFQQAGFPDALFRAALIAVPAIASLIDHRLIQAVTLTGSTGAGRAIGSQAGRAIKKSVLELGGSDPYLILEDADIASAAKICAQARMINGGQSCVAAKRFIAVESIYKKFTEEFITHMRNFHMGSPLEEGVTLGPLARRDLRDQLHAQVQKSKQQGAVVALGGELPPTQGAFYFPTVLVDVKAHMCAYTEELFGPVASIIKVGDEQEALTIANDTVFGLGAAVFTQDLKRGERIARYELQAGCCFVNEAVKSDPHLPFGGIKQSGYGRELAGFGIREFVNIKTVYIK